MNYYTSQYLKFLTLVLPFIIIQLVKAQSPCDPDQNLPIFISCPGDFSYTINDTTTCQPSTYWPTPVVFDSCSGVLTGFNDFLSFANWSQTTVGSGTPQYSDFTPDSIRIRGTSGGSFGSTSTATMCIRFDCGGNISFDWSARKTGFALSFSGDHAYYLHNGTPVQLTPNSLVSYATGSVQLVLNAGDELCFRVESNNITTQTFLTISNMVYNNLQLAIISGPQPDSYPGAGDGTPLGPGVHTVVYQVTDCSNNTDTCSFNITVLDTPPTITCPPSETILLDTFDCNRVYCYNIETQDNCVNSDLLIPGFTYLGTYNGNTYYISAAGAANREFWPDANLIAAQLGGHLVTITDAGENAFLNANIPLSLNPLDDQYWIGLRYIPMSAQHAWITCEEFNYANWGFGQPGIIPGNYVYFWDFLLGTWFDSPSLLARRFIVEFEGGLQVQLLSGLPPGSPFPPGVTTNVYQVTDANGQTASCSFSINVIGSTSLSCKNINVSLDQECLALITPEMLLAGQFNCYDVFNVTLTHYGIPVPNPIDSHYLGHHIIATVTDPTTGNSCWSDVVIEDKLAPVAICEADTTDCYLFNFNFPLDFSGQDCSPYTVKTVDERIEHIHCDAEYLKAVYRDILITDQGGNIDQCTDTILVKRIKAIDIWLPDQEVVIECDQSVPLDANGHPSPLYTGVPFTELYDGTTLDIWPLNILLDCNLLIEYEDIDLGEINCVRKIMRNWKVREWWCNQEITRFALQVIIITDIAGPVITHAPYGFTATTGQRDCEARVLLPTIEAIDYCHDDIRIDIAYPGGILLNQNGGYVNLPVGEDTVIYRLYDACYNLTTDTIIITVRDITEPVAVCDRNTVVSLNHAGYNWVPAEVFDDGSFDECALHHFEVRRMDSDFCGGFGEDDWGPEVGFCCDDVGNTIMVALRAVDHSGNSGICMVSVEVQDKDKPLITCLPDITIDCRFDIDYDHLEVFGKIVADDALRDTIIIDPQYYHVIGGHPLDGYAQDNCPPTIVETFDGSNINQCGLGYLIRYFYAVDQFGNFSDYCYQFITVVNHDTFDINDIVWPPNLDTAGVCDPAELIPNRLTPPYDRPVTNDDECSLIGISYEDKVFSATLPGDPCFKIIRKWSVIDWCQRDINGDIVIWTKDQVIKVMNFVDPTITRISPDTVVCSYDINCAPIPVSFSIEATDDCTDYEQMLYTYKIDYYGDGSFDVVHSAIGGNSADGTWPIGRHLVIWVVEDRCGNTALGQFVMDLRNCKSPVAYCLNGLSTNLTPMDTSGDGIPDIAMDTIWASDFDAGSYHPCGYPVDLSFSSDITNNYIVFDCDSLGTRQVELWVTDINGNTSFCRTFIDVQDNLHFCPPSTKNSNVEGIVTTENGQGIANVAVGNLMTDGQGRYSFYQLPNGQNLTVCPLKNTNWLNGISTADIVKIQRHILGIESLNSPYKLIAADVNKSKTITAKDVSDLRRMILGIINEIPGNTSWQFVQKSFVFNDPKNTLNENYKECYEINFLNGNLNLDFIGLKTGDVNLSASNNLGTGLTGRNQNTMELEISDKQLAKDEIAEIEIRVANASLFDGMQFTLAWDKHQLELLNVTGNSDYKIGDENYSILRKQEALMSFCWNGELNDGDWILKMQYKARKTTRFSDAIHMSSEITPALAVSKEYNEEVPLTLRFNGVNEDEFIVMQNEPNPWNQHTTIGMFIPVQGEVDLSIYDLTGKVLLNKKITVHKGYNEVQISSDLLPGNGVYYYQLDYLNHTATRKMIISKE